MITSAEAADVDHPEYIMIDLQVDLETASSGEMIFFMGTDDRREQNETDLIVPPQGDLRNNNLMRLRESLGHYTNGYRQFFRSILNSDGSLSLNVSFFSAVNESNYYGIIFEASFSFDTGGSSAEYEYLSFVREIRLTGVNLLKPSTVTRRQIEEDEMEKGRVRIGVDLEPRMSLDLRSEGGSHRRTPAGESFGRTVDISSFLGQGNGMIVSDSIIFSPLSIFCISVTMTLLTLAALILIWMRNRFRRWGLIFPILTALMSLSPVIVLFRPALNIYSYHDSAFVLILLINISLLTGCYLVNPKKFEKPKDYEEEKGKKFKMPKVVYVDRTVYIEAKGSGKIDGLDPYDILGVNSNMSLGDIERAYKKQILKYHPDKFEDSPDAIKSVSLKETERLNAAFDHIKKKHGH